MLFTGQRRSDVHRMTWADVTGDTIRVVQQKTGAKLTIPLHADLRAILSETKREHVAILTTEYGRAFTVDGFSGFMRDAIKAAGLPLECQPHGLRKAAGRRLAEAGCTAQEIMAVLGHKTLARGRTLHPRRRSGAARERRRCEARRTEGEQLTPKPVGPSLGKCEKQTNDQSVRNGVALPRGLEPLFSP